MSGLGYLLTKNRGRLRGKNKGLPAQVLQMDYLKIGATNAPARVGGSNLYYLLHVWPHLRPNFYTDKINVWRVIMARPRTPTKILELRGAFKAHPNRARPNEPTPMGPIGTFIQGPTDIGLIWNEIVSHTAPGVLTVSDRLALELVCRLMAEIRLKPDEIAVGKVVALSNLLGKFGMIPADRAKLLVPDTDVDDEWAGF
jgi:hypothetical protein